MRNSSFRTRRSTDRRPRSALSNGRSRPMSRIVPTCLALLACLAALPAAGQQPRAEPLVDQVRTAIDTGVRFLRARERNGTWERGPYALSRPGGSTALALLALLNCGAKPDDPLIQRGLDYLRKVAPTYTYVVGLQTMVLAEAGDPRDLPRIQGNVDWLVDARVMRGGRLRGWDY